MADSNGNDPQLQYQYGFPELEMADKTAAVDWLTVTASTASKQDLLHHEAGRIVGILKAEGNTQKPWRFKGYDGWVCAGFRYGTRQDGSIVMMSGVMADLNWPVMLTWADNCSRVDLAVTLTLEKPMEGIASHYYALMTLDQTAKGRQPRKLTFMTNNDGGETVYLGSRASEQYGRVYDKGRETSEKLDVPKGKIWRYEVEFKAGRAKKIAAQLLEKARYMQDPVRDDIAQTVHKWFLSRGCAPIWKPDKGEAFYMETSVNLTDDETSLRWLSTQVSPTVARLLASGKGDETLEALGLLGT